MKRLFALHAILFGTASFCFAETLPRVAGPMEHVGITFDGTSIVLTPPKATGLAMTRYEDSYDPPADILNGRAYSSQYGWLVSAAFVPPTDSAVWIEVLSQTPGLLTYEGGMRPMRANHTYAPVFGTADAPLRWEWNGLMHHPWFAAETPGDYAATYRVYIGDSSGNPRPAYGDDTITLTWQFVPEPASLVGLLIGGLLSAGRRR